MEICHSKNNNNAKFQRSVLSKRGKEEERENEEGNCGWWGDLELEMMVGEFSIMDFTLLTNNFTWECSKWMRARAREREIWR